MKTNVMVLLLTITAPFLFMNDLGAADRTPEQLVNEARARVTSVSIHDVKKMLDAGEDVILLDVRDGDEFGKGHLPGALNISRGLLEFVVADKIPDKNAKIVVY
jgi:predicted sulfurtransferase